MKVELRIDPGCDGMSVVINAPALTDEVKALAARLEGGGVLVGWPVSYTHLTLPTT